MVYVCILFAARDISAYQINLSNCVACSSVLVAILISISFLVSVLRLCAIGVKCVT